MALKFVDLLSCFSEGLNIGQLEILTMNKLSEIMSTINLKYAPECNFMMDLVEQRKYKFWIYFLNIGNGKKGLRGK